LLDRTSWYFSKKGSDLGRVLLCLGALYLAVLPALWWSSGVVRTAPGVMPGPKLAEAFVFSLTTLVTLTMGHFRPGGWVVNALQGAEALSAYFSLGYLLWMSQRSYDQ